MGKQSQTSEKRNIANRANLVFFEVSYYAECGKEFGKEFGAWL